jgi:hypothetical protein
VLLGLWLRRQGGRRGEGRQGKAEGRDGRQPPSEWSDSAPCPHLDPFLSSTAVDFHTHFLSFKRVKSIAVAGGSEAAGSGAALRPCGYSVQNPCWPVKALVVTCSPSSQVGADSNLNSPPPRALRRLTEQQ